MNPKTTKIHQHEPPTEIAKNNKKQKQLLHDGKHHSLVTKHIEKMPGLRITLPGEVLRVPWFADIRLELEGDGHAIWQSISSKVVDLQIAMQTGWILMLRPEGNLASAFASAANMTPKVQEADVA
jgi:hypothetical protein